MKTISIHQPNYIPWLGYFYKIDQSDVFVYLDDVQFIKKGMHNYHYIKTPQGPFRLKIPVIATYYSKINSVVPNDELDWKDKHLKTIASNYKRAPFFEEVFEDFSGLLNRQYENLARMNEAIIQFYCSKFGITTSFVDSSTLNITTTNEERILDICKILGADVYYSGTGARSYQDESSFEKNGIILKYSEYKPFVYPQQWGDFQSNVTVIDYLMNCGYDWGRVLESQK